MTTRLRETRGTFELLHWAAAEFGHRLLMTSAFGMNGVVLVDLVHRALDDLHLAPPVVFVDTGYHFPETLLTAQNNALLYGLDLQVMRPYMSRAEFEVCWGPLYERNPDLCCALRKVAPMRRALARFQPRAILTARSRFQTDDRAGLKVVEWGTDPLRINPLAGWKQADIEEYARHHDLVVNPLHAEGYPSIGCQPCTARVAEGEDYRAGRWPGQGKTECGLWADNGQQEGQEMKLGEYNLIAPGVTLGGNVEIGSFCIIEEGCEIGDNTQIRNYVELRKNTKVGANCYIDSGVKTSGDCTIGDGVTLRYNAIIAREVTVLDGAFVSPNAMTIYSTHEGEARPGTVIGQDCHIGTNAVIGPGVFVGNGAVVGALAFVNRDVQDGQIVVGQPAKPLPPKAERYCEEGGDCACAADC